MRLDTVTIRFEADTSGLHNALDDVLDHIDEVNEAMGVYASGVLDDTDDTGPAIGDIVSLASGGELMTVEGFCYRDSLPSRRHQP